MDRDQIIARLRAHESELRAAGVARLAIFGSVARGEARLDSDVDVLVGLTPEAAAGGFVYFGRLASLAQHLQRILGHPVDLVAEPVHKDRLRRQIDREAVRAF